MNTINFTQEHKNQLTKLMTEMLFSNGTIKGTLNTEINAVQLLHQTSVKTLQSLYINTSKEIENQSKLDKWAMSSYQQAKLIELKGQSELLDLLIGYKKSEAVKESNAAILQEKRNSLKKLKEENKTPAERVSELEKEIAELEV